MKIDIVVTSCIYPNTFFINNDLTLNDRISNTHDNLKIICEALIKTNLYANIYLLESSFFEIKSDILEQLIPFKFKNKINFIQLTFTIDEKNLISKKGKGYSELLMIKKYLEIRNDTDYFLKISGRYQILNIAKLSDDKEPP